MKSAKKIFPRICEFPFFKPIILDLDFNFFWLRTSKCSSVGEFDESFLESKSVFIESWLVFRSFGEKREFLDYLGWLEMQDCRKASKVWRPMDDFPPLDLSQFLLTNDSLVVRNFIAYESRITLQLCFQFNNGF